MGSSVLQEVQKYLESAKSLVVVQATIPKELAKTASGYLHSVAFAVAPLDLSLVSNKIGVYDLKSLEAIRQQLLPGRVRPKIEGKPFTHSGGNLYFGSVVLDETIGQAEVRESVRVDVDDVALPGWAVVPTTGKTGKAVEKVTIQDVLRNITVTIYPDIVIAKWALLQLSSGISLKDLSRHVSGLSKTSSFRKVV